jgi:hypothetical protein
MESREKALLDMPAGLRRGEPARVKWEDFDFKGLSTSAWSLLFHNPIISGFSVTRDKCSSL